MIVKMTSLKEFVSSVFDSSRDRLNNPIIGTFLFSWLAINWRIILVLLFSSKKIEEKIEFIETSYVDIDLNLWIPLTFAVFYVLILPYLMVIFDWLLQRGITYRRRISTNHILSDIQNRQEIAAEEWQLEKIRQGSPDISGMKEKIVDLENQLKEKDNRIIALDNDLQPQPDIQIKQENRPKRKSTKRPIKQTSPKSTSATPLTANKENPSSNQPKSIDYPAMKEIVIRDLAKTEREWILIYSLYASDFGKNVITTDDIRTKYDESNRATKSRRQNISNNIKTMVKSGQIKFINDNEMILTKDGQEVATEILNR